MVEATDVRIPGRHKARALKLSGTTLSRERRLDIASAAVVVVIALVINSWRLSETGNGNTYYAAAVRSMAGSWHNFFFASFDPGGFISVDKPPVFLWFGALSVRVFGYSSWAILLPSAFAGAATVGLLWLIVRKYFGLTAATVAGAALAFSPISVAVNRLNLPEPFLILALMGAAGATLQSLESRRWWAWIALAGALVGIGFNIKMLAAWIPGPALALAVVLATPRFDRKAIGKAAAQLVILALATFAVSGAWMLVVDAIPANDRPYVGGSSDNSVQNLALDYNGVGRVDGNESTRPGGAQPPVTFSRGNAGTFPNNVGPFNANGGLNAPPGGAFNGRGGIIAGTPGMWRMFDDANGPQIAWLLPFALLIAPIALWHWRASRLRRSAVVLALGWVVLFGAVFSYAQGIYHSYYTSALMPGIALLTGAGIVATIELARRDARWMIAFIPAAWATAMVQLHQANRVQDFYNAVPVVAVTIIAVATLAGAGFALFRRTQWIGPALMAAVGAMMMTPAVWSQYEARNPSLNTTLPQAGPRQGAAGRSFGSAAFDGGVGHLAAWIESHRDGSARWDLAVSSAMNASTLIADYELSVMALGGFSGSDPTINVDEFADYVAAGDVRYVLASQGGPGGGITIGGPGGGFLPNAQPGTGTNRGFPGTAPSGGFNRGLNPFPASGRGVSPQGPRGGNTAPPQRSPVPVRPVPAAQGKGATAVMAAVRSACEPVTGTDAPVAYSGNLYDCSGAADRLRSVK